MKPVVLCGDLNVAHQEIDIKNAKSNRGNAGFTDEEREKVHTAFAETGLWTASAICIRTERTPTPGGVTSETRGSNNVGWRIDYFVVSRKLKDAIQGAAIHPDVFGSDHCPVELTI